MATTATRVKTIKSETETLDELKNFISSFKDIEDSDLTDVKMSVKVQNFIKEILIEKNTSKNLNLVIKKHGKDLLKDAIDYLNTVHGGLDSQNNFAVQLCQNDVNMKCDMLDILLIAQLKRSRSFLNESKHKHGADDSDKAPKDKEQAES